MYENCKDCYYNTPTRCKVFTERPTNCSRKADETEGKRVEADIKAYGTRFDVDVSVYDTIREKLDGCFMELYEQGLPDSTIAKTLGLNSGTVANYRKKKGLENIYRKKACVNRPVKNKLSS